MKTLFGIKFDDITKEEASSQVFKHIDSGHGVYKIYTPNPEIVMKALENEDYYKVLNRGNLITPDGIGIILASKIKGLGINKRLTGISLMEELLFEANKRGKSVYLLGAAPGVAEKAAENIRKKFNNIKIIGTNDGYFDTIEEITLCEKIEADILFVALGAPKQEIFIDSHPELKVKVAMGVGGCLDVYSGNVPRAPKFFQKTGTEWLYRAFKDPKRIGRLVAIPRFLTKVFFSSKARHRR